MQKLVEIEDSSCLSYICGAQDSNLKFLEDELNIQIHIKSEGLLLKGKKQDVDRAFGLIEKITKLGSEGFSLSKEELSQYLNPNTSDKDGPMPNQFRQSDKFAIKVPSARKRIVLPKTKGQNDYVNAMQRYDIVFSTGPAGTGKTYLAMAMAVNFLMEKKVHRIVLTRPAVEAGESLGFLPGDIQAKLKPYLRPLYDALYDMMETEMIEDYLEAGVIEIVPLAYMRGRTLNNAFVILDEAQNCTSGNLKMFLTRLGFDSKAVITGDITQSDLPAGKPVGLLEAIELLKPIKGIEFINLDKKDVVRHPLIQEIIQAYENINNKKRH